MRITGPFQTLHQRRLFWGVLSVCCLLLLFTARIGHDRAVDRQIDATRTRALSYANGVVAKYVREDRATGDLQAPIRQRLLIALRNAVFADPSAARVRVFGADGGLRFTSDDPVRTNSTPGRNDPGMAEALRGSVSATLVREPFTFPGRGAPTDTDLVQVFVPLYLAGHAGPAGAVEVDFLLSGLRLMAAGSWPTIQLLLGLALLGCIGMAVVGWVPLRPRDTDLGRDAVANTGDEGSSITPPIASEPPAGPEPSGHAMLDDLERRVSEAEARAQEARERLAGAPAPSDAGISSDASDLRARLARAADRKRLSAAEDDR
jgi:hypothetical protein